MNQFVSNYPVEEYTTSVRMQLNLEKELGISIQLR
jgi:hypothetical protein